MERIELKAVFPIFIVIGILLFSQTAFADTLNLTPLNSSHPDNFTYCNNYQMSPGNYTLGDFFLAFQSIDVNGTRNNLGFVNNIDFSIRLNTTGNPFWLNMLHAGVANSNAALTNDEFMHLLTCLGSMGGGCDGIGANYPTTYIDISDFDGTYWYRIRINLPPSTQNDMRIYLDYSSPSSSSAVITRPLNFSVCGNYFGPLSIDNSSSDWTSYNQSVRLNCSSLPSGNCYQASYCIDDNKTCVPGSYGSITSGIYDVPVNCASGNICQKYVSYRSLDNLGQAEIMKYSKLVRIDKQPPFTSDNVSSGWTNFDQIVRLACYDNTTNCSTAKYCIGTKTCVPNLSIDISSGYADIQSICQSGKNCTQYMRYYSADSFGNNESIRNATAVIKIDKTMPVSSISAKTNASVAYTFGKWSKTTYVNVTLSCADNGSGCYAIMYCSDTDNSCNPSITYNNTVKIMTEGLTYFRYASVDNASNIESVSSKQIMIDTTAPITQSNAPAAWVNTAFNLTLTPLDNGSGVNYTKYKVDSNLLTNGTAINISTNKNHTITYYSVDNVGNVEANKTVYAALDMTKPSIVLRNDGVNYSAWAKTNITVSFNCSDNLSGIMNCTETQMFAYDTAGQNVTGIAIDRAGNTNSTSVMIKIDMTKPSIIAYPSTLPNSKGWYKSNVNVAFNCTDATSGVIKCTSGQDVSAEGTSVVNGSSTDNAGNVNTTSMTIKIDKTAPYTTDNAPAGWMNTSFTVTLTPYDNLSGVQYTSYSFDNGPVQSGNDIIVNTNGNHTISYYSVDNADNKELEKTIYAALLVVTPTTTTTTTTSTTTTSSTTTVPTTTSTVPTTTSTTVTTTTSTSTTTVPTTTTTTSTSTTTSSTTTTSTTTETTTTIPVTTTTIEEVYVPENISDDEPYYQNLSTLLDTTGNATLPNDILLVRNASENDYSVLMQNGTVISGGANWSGELLMPTVLSNSSSYEAPHGSGKSTTIDVIVDMGASGELNFSQPVMITLGGQAGKSAGWTRGNSTLNIITSICDNITSPTNMTLDNDVNRECYGNSGTDLVIWSYHFTEFAAYRETIIPSTTTTVRSSGGGGGGGGGGPIYTSTTMNLTNNTIARATTSTVTKAIVPTTSTYIAAKTTTTTLLTTTTVQNSPTGNVLDTISGDDALKYGSIAMLVVLVVLFMLRDAIKKNFAAEKYSDNAFSPVKSKIGEKPERKL